MNEVLCGLPRLTGTEGIGVASMSRQSVETDVMPGLKRCTRREQEDKMTQAHNTERGIRRSSLLSRVLPRKRGAVSEARECRPQKHSACTRPAVTEAKARPHGWRDVTARLGRERTAEGICTRFFSATDSSDVSSAAQTAEMVTAGQGLEALSHQWAAASDQGDASITAAHGSTWRDCAAGEPEKPLGIGSTYQCIETARAA